MEVPEVQPCSRHPQRRTGAAAAVPYVPQGAVTKPARPAHSLATHGDCSGSASAQALPALSETPVKVQKLKKYYVLGRSKFGQSSVHR